MKLKKLSIKVIAFVILLLLNVSTVKAMETTVLRYGGNYSDYFLDMIVEDNNHIAVGRSNSTNIEGMTNNGKGDAIIVKYKGDEIEWNKSYGTSLSDGFNAVYSTSDGYIVVGFKNSDHYKGYHNYSIDSTSIIVKYDKNGNILWEKEYQKNSILYDVIETKENEYVAVGTYEDGLYTYRPLIIKFDNTGKILSEKKFTESDYDYEGIVFNKIELDKDNNYVVMGSSSFTPNDGYPPMLVQFDKDFKVNWYKTYTLDNQFAIFNDIKVDKDGNYVIVGGASITSILVTGDQNNAFILKYDKSGNLVSENILKHYKHSSFDSLVILQDKYVMMGRGSNFDSYNISNVLNYDLILFEYDLKEKKYNIEILDKPRFGEDISSVLVNTSNNAYSLALAVNDDFLGTKSYGTVDSVIVKAKEVYFEDGIIDEDKKPTDDKKPVVEGNTGEKIEVPDTLSNSSVIIIALGVLLVSGGVILYFGVLKNRKTKDM